MATGIIAVARGRVAYPDIVWERGGCDAQDESGEIALFAATPAIAGRGQREGDVAAEMPAKSGGIDGRQ